MLRRDFIRTASALSGIYPLTNTGRSDIFDTTFFMEDEVVRIKVGEFSCTVFKDLMFKYLPKDFFVNASPQELEQSLKKYPLTADYIPSPFIAMLIQLHDKKILIDTGVGFFEKPVLVRGNSIVFKGKLQQLLMKEKIEKEHITDVIITHFHPDHIGGIASENGQLNFPNARFHLHEEEWNFWHSSQSDNQPEQFKYFVKNNVTILKELNLHLISGDFVEIIPGLTAVKCGGHTPGQIALILHSDKDQLLYISDAFLHPLHIEKLDWRTNYDLDHENAKLSRIKLLSLAYEEKMLVNAFHFDFPGLGRVDRTKSNWTWNYSKE
jgi:glyoxylase-like metal-dependent hydrolase (beta-lactamase superfamily II)